MNVGSIKIIDKYVGNVLALTLGLLPKQFPLKHDQFKKVAFIQLWGIGESITTLNAIKAFKQKYPQVEVSVFCTTRVEKVFQHQSFIDHLCFVSMKPLEILGYLKKHWKEYDLIIDFEEFLNISSLMSFALGKQRIGFSHGLRSRLYNACVDYSDKQHVAQTHMDLMRLVNIKEEVKELLPIHIKKDAIAKMRERLNALKGPIVAIAPGAAESAKSRMWPVERYAELSDWLIKEKKATIILIGNQEERELCRTLKSRALPESQKFMHSFAGETSLDEALALIKESDLLVCNDSGPMHMGSCLKTKTIAFFGPNLPVRFGGLGKHCINIYEGSTCKLSPCINVHKGQIPECLWGENHKNHVMCMKNITLPKVKNAVENLLSN